MPLPTIDTYTFPVTLPSSGAEILVRPYLVKEEKILLMAQESNNYTEQAEAVANVIRNCTSGAVEPKVAPFFDIEYLLLQLRAKSVGEIATPIYECHNTISTEPGVHQAVTVECKNHTPIKINLSEVKVSDILAERGTIVISPKYTLKLRYPTIFTVNEMFLAAVNGQSPKQSSVIDALSDIFDELIDSSTEIPTVYKFSDYTEQERIDFMGSLPPSCYDKMLEFLGAMPTVKTVVEYTCGKCGFHHTINLSGLVDFLAWR